MLSTFLSRRNELLDTLVPRAVTGRSGNSGAETNYDMSGIGWLVAETRIR